MNKGMTNASNVEFFEYQIEPFVIRIIRTIRHF